MKKSATRWGRFGIFQFTPLREGRRGSPAKGNCLYISIHAPPRGATRERRWYTLSHIISIHAPPRGATGAWRSVPVARRRYFNSRPSARGDGSQRRERGRTANFNSRPSARGDKSFPASKLFRAFQFTPLREGRPIGQTKTFGIFLFQFTPLREGRPSVLHSDGRNDHFNSRPSARGDVHENEVLAKKAISIHAPPRGATCLLGFRFCTLRFQFTPLREGRLSVLWSKDAAEPYFNSRPSARGDIHAWRR